MAVGAETRAMIDCLEDNDGITLTPTERLLMATDGTVTHMLEALTRDHVTVDIISRDVMAGVLHRDVVLRQARDGSPLVWAASDVPLDPLEDDITDELVEGTMGIGDLLRARGAETRRRITDMRVRHAGEENLPPFVNGQAMVYLERTYNVHQHGERVMTITEFFPRDRF